MWRTGADETSGLSLWRPGFARSCLRLDHHHPRDGGSALLRRSRPGAKPPYPLRQGVCHLRRRLRRLGGTLRLRRLDPTGPCRRGTVLRSVVDRVQLVDRQPVYLPHPHGKVQRPTEIAAIRPAGRYHRRLIFRGVFIALGQAILEAWAWVFFIFGAFLLYSAIDQVREYRHRDDDDDEDPGEDGRFMAWFRRTVPATGDYRGTKFFFVRENGKTLATSMFMVCVALGATDLLFALDSIPASYGLTSEGYLILTANVFALMGLRQLYFLIGSLLERLVYLSLGLAVILGFIASSSLATRCTTTDWTRPGSALAVRFRSGFRWALSP